MYTPRYLGHFFAVTFWALYIRSLVLGDSFDALEGLAAFFTTILVGRHRLFFLHELRMPIQRSKLTLAGSALGYLDHTLAGSALGYLDHT